MKKDRGFLSGQMLYLCDHDSEEACSDNVEAPITDPYYQPLDEILSRRI